MAMRVLQDLSIFDQIAAKGRVTSKELARLSQADQTLIGTFHLGCFNRSS